MKPRVKLTENEFINTPDYNKKDKQPAKAITISLSRNYEQILDNTQIELITYGKIKLNRSDIIKASLQAFLTLSKEEQLELIKQVKNNY